MEYVCDNGKILKCGYTTGACATAGAVACAKALLEGDSPSHVDILTPNGTVLTISIAKLVISSTSPNSATCTVVKDGGDDIDVTHGIEVVTQVQLVSSGITIDGGVGVGTVTKRGLDQPVGNKAINSTPRKMVTSNLQTLANINDYTGGFSVLISVPMGESLAQKTFNPRLGIVGGISILGTTGIVRPMSDKAILDTIRTELNVKKASEVKKLVLTLGNYGKYFTQAELNIRDEDTVQCSNFIGDALDLANELGFKDVLLVGHIGKLVKLGCGIMNTHSKYGDARMETLAICALESGADVEILKSIMNCVTTDDALTILKQYGILEPTMSALKRRIAFYLNRRATDSMHVEFIVFSNVHGTL